MLLARSTDGGASFSAPVKVGDYFDLPDCATYQNGADAGRACVPEKADTSNSIFRATNYPVGAVNPRTGAVVVTYGSYINKHSNENNGCVPDRVQRLRHQHLRRGQGPRRVQQRHPCQHVHRPRRHVQRRDDRRTAMPTVNDARGSAPPTSSGSGRTSPGAAQLAVAYYDRQYGNDEVTGYSDYSVTASSASSQKVFRATSSSNPPPTQFTGLFMGDYAALAVTGQTAYPFWADTRTPGAVPVHRDRDAREPTAGLHRTRVQRRSRQRPGGVRPAREHLRPGTVDPTSRLVRVGRHLPTRTVKRWPCLRCGC